MLTARVGLTGRAHEPHRKARKFFGGDDSEIGGDGSETKSSVINQVGSLVAVKGGLHSNTVFFQSRQSKRPAANAAEQLDGTGDAILLHEDRKKRPNGPLAVFGKTEKFVWRPRGVAAWFTPARDGGEEQREAARQGVKNPRDTMLLVSRDLGEEMEEEEEEEEEVKEDFDVLRGFVAEEEAEALMQRIIRNQRQEKNEAEGVATDVKDAKSTFVIENARDYQRQIFDCAVTRNTICMLGTGLGKTFIAVMVVKEILAQKPGTKAVILCPTAFLVEQQGAVFRSNAPHHVSTYHGGRSGIDDWKPDRWQKEWAEKRVFVMTPQVLVNALNHAYITLDSMSVIVLDECHHVCSGDHPMRQIMHRVGEMRPVPRVLGLTASPLISVPKDLTEGIKLLEAQMAGSQLVTAHVGDAYKPPVEEVFYFKNCRSIDLADTLLRMFPGSKKDSPDAFRRQKVARTISLWFNLCGRAARRYLLAQSNAKWGESLMEMVSEALRRFGLTGFEQITRPGEDEEVPDDILCPKFVKLLEILKARPAGMREQLLVFVEQRDMAYQLSIEITKRTGISADWLIGISSALDVNHSSRAMMRRFKKFKAGEIEVLVATAAAEEGIDVPGVSAVISYDGVKQVKSYVQMRGRCRFSMSRYVIFNQNRAQRIRYEQAAKVESDLFHWISNRPTNLRVNESFLETLEEQAALEDTYRESYVVASTGASCDQRSCVSLLFRFAHSFSGEESVVVHFDHRGGQYVGILRLSNFLPKELRMYISSAHASKRDCKRHLCMLAVKKLHANKWLTDRLLPITTSFILGYEQPSHPTEPISEDMLQILAAQLEARKQRVKKRSGGIVPMTEEEDEAIARKREEISEAKSVRAAALLPNQEEIVCSLWATERPKLYVVQFGRFGKFKFVLPVDILAGDVMTIDHPNVGFMNVEVLEVHEIAPDDENNGFSAEEMRFSDILWNFIDRKHVYEAEHRFPMCCGDKEELAAMLAQHRRLEEEAIDPELFKRSVAGALDFLWISKTREKPKIYAAQSWSPIKSAKYEFNDPEKAPTFEAYFSAKYGVNPPRPGDADRPMAIVKIVKNSFRARHFPMGVQKSTYREELPFYCARHFWMLRQFYVALECVPTFVRRARRLYAARRVALMHFSVEEIAAKPSIIDWFCEAVSPGSAGLDGPSLERLEFLGDSVLKMMVTRRLYEEFPYDEGRLTDLRCVVISNSRLAQVFVVGAMGGSVDPRGIADWCRLRSKIEMSLKGAADAMEGLLGAMYMASDCDMERVVRAATKMGLFNRFPSPLKAHRPSFNYDEDDDSKIPVELQELQANIGYRFKSPLLLLEAMTHTTHGRSIVGNYNRLELLGDAVVDIACVGNALRSDKTLTPGGLSDWRYICGSSEALARISKYLGLNRYLQHFSSRLTRELDTYSAADPAPSIWIDLAPKIMADVFESLMGAVLVDTRYNYEQTIQFCVRLAAPVWTKCTPNPDLEPTREIRELLAHVPGLKWDRVPQAILSNGFMITKMRKPVPNWQRLVAWKACQMLKARPELIVALADPLATQKKHGFEEPPNPILLDMLDKLFI